MRVNRITDEQMALDIKAGRRYQNGKLRYIRTPEQRLEDAERMRKWTARNRAKFGAGHPDYFPCGTRRRVAKVARATVAERRETDRITTKKCRRNLREECIEKLGGRCSLCPETRDVLEFHHTNHDGYLDRRINCDRSNCKLMRDVRDGKRNDIVLLCASCHVQIGRAHV